MLNTLKGLLSAGKEILNEGKVVVNADKLQKSAEDDNYNYTTGSEVLTHFQQSWVEMHSLNEENARNASFLADEINSFHTKITSDYRNLAQIVHILTSVPNLKTSIDHCATQITNIHDSFEKVEKSLMSLEDLIEKIELEQRKIDHRHQLALYKEKKLANLEKARTTLATTHAQNVIMHDLKVKKKLQERQQVFEEEFQKDLETYKSLGEIPKIEVHNSQPSALLEDMQIDYDAKELDNFLGEG